MYIPRNKNVVKNTVFQQNSSSEQVLSSSVVDITGTEISYTPEAGADRVVYEYNIQYFNDPDSDNNTYIELNMNSGSGYVSLGSGYRINETNQNVQGQGHYEGKFVIDAWSGSRSLKMTVRAYDNARRVTLHKDESGNLFDPVINIYSVM